MKRAALITSAVLGLGSMVADSIATELQLGSGAKESRFEREKRRISRQFEISITTIEAISFVESTNNPRAKSSAGALGLMQVMGNHAGSVLCPEAKKPDDLYNPAINIKCGARILRGELDRYDDDLALALGAYNGGPKCVRGGKIICPAAKKYSDKVLMVLAQSLIK
jgi:soluble lytic murein transglycosylase-like protein